MLVNTIKRRLDVPGEPGEWIEIRRLSWRQMDTARETRQTAVLLRVKALGGDIFKALQEQAASAPAPVEAVAGLPAESVALAEPERPDAGEYDRAALLAAGVVGWSYADEAGNRVKVSPATLDQLDEETAAWLATEILAFSRPATGEERKNA